LKFCEECFSNIEIRSIIKNTDMLDNCDFNSEHKNVFVCDIDTGKNIESIKDILRQIIDIYTPDEELSKEYPHAKKDLLQNSLEKKWSLFNLDSEEIYNLLEKLFKNDSEIDKRLFSGLVGVKEEIELDNSKLIVNRNNWTEFVESIKFENRFHTKTINLEVLEHFLKYTENTIMPNEFPLYRCRVSNVESLCKEQMSAPPKEIATAGRLNAEWISTLYLSDNQDACVQEVRAGFHDCVYIGEFEIDEPIKVADLRNFEDITLDPAGEYLVEYYLNRNTLMKISNEFARPANNSYKGIHYLPLQYISDFIKSSPIGFNGIMYKSVMNNNSVNLVLFDPKIAKCISVRKKIVTEVDYKLN